MDRCSCERGYTSADCTKRINQSLHIIPAVSIFMRRIGMVQHFCCEGGACRIREGYRIETCKTMNSIQLVICSLGTTKLYPLSRTLLKSNGLFFRTDWFELPWTFDRWIFSRYRVPECRFLNSLLPVLTGPAVGSSRVFLRRGFRFCALCGIRS